MSSLEKNKIKLLPLVRAAAKFGDFILASGKKSDFYFDGRLITCSAQGSYLISSIILEKINNYDVQAIGGMTMGADPIAAAVAALSFKTVKPIDCFIVRKESKTHGTCKQVEGVCPRGSRLVIVDDVVTTAGSTLKAIKAVEQIGCKVELVICLVDREEGGREALSQYNFWPIFKKRELY